jgi:uncharacterized protein (DUF58 family)
VREALSALTTRGRAFLAAGITVTLCAAVLGFDALLRVGILAVALPMLSALAVGRARYRFGASRRLSPQRVSPGQPSTVTLSLANGGAMPMGLLLLEDHVPYALGTRARFVLDQAGPRWREDVHYTVRSEVRGRYEVGPLAIGVSDPFGFIELVRTYSETSPLMVVPTVHPLPPIRLNGEWTGQGENRPRAFAVGSAEDVTTREYRRGDDLRRVHWRSTARTGELMVRREEQPWQSRATIVLDSRRTAHRGSGAASSLEWLISAAASVAVHLTHAGFAVRLVTDRPLSDASSWHDRRPDDAEQSGPILDELAVMSLSDGATLVHAVDAVTASPGLVVALLGAQTTTDLGELTRMRAHGSTVIGLALDTSAWGDEPDAGHPGSHRLVQHLSARGWYAVSADPYESPAMPWGRVGTLLHNGSGRGRSA